MLTRREVVALGMGLAGMWALASNPLNFARADEGGADGLVPLPPAEPNPDDQFGVDLAINMDTIDGYLGRPDVAYRDMRMIFDPAHWEDLGEDPYASTVLEGFRMVPFPYLVTLPPLPVDGCYEDETLFDAEWSEEGELLSVSSNYKESMQVLNDLFPRDKAVFLVCGGAGYASFTRQLLLYLGWDPQKVYTVGGMWDYRGDRTVDIIEYGRTEEDDMYALWRADYTLIDFTLLRPESVRRKDQRKAAGDE